VSALAALEPFECRAQYDEGACYAAILGEVGIEGPLYPPWTSDSLHQSGGFLQSLGILDEDQQIGRAADSKGSQL